MCRYSIGIQRQYLKRIERCWFFSSAVSYTRNLGIQTFSISNVSISIDERPRREFWKQILIRHKAYSRWAFQRFSLFVSSFSKILNLNFSQKFDSQKCICIKSKLWESRFLTGADFVTNSNPFSESSPRRQIKIIRL